jgi:hypothetical protein
MHLLSQAGEVFAEFDAGDCGGDGSKGATDFERGVRLHVPQVLLSGTSLQKEDQTGFRPSTLDPLGAEQIRKRHSGQGERPDLEQFAAWPCGEG